MALQPCVHPIHGRVPAASRRAGRVGRGRPCGHVRAGVRHRHRAPAPARRKAPRLRPARRKAPGYGQLAKTLADAGRTCPLVLFCFPGPHRPQGAGRLLRRGGVADRHRRHPSGACQPGRAAMAATNAGPGRRPCRAVRSRHGHSRPVVPDTPARNSPGSRPHGPSHRPSGTTPAATPTASTLPTDNAEGR